MINMKKIVEIIKTSSFHLFILSLLVVISYANSIHNRFVSDDINGILNNRNITNLNVIFSQSTFLRYLIFYVIHLFFGLQPWAYRLVDIFFHIGTVIILYLFLRDTINKRVAFIAAALYAVHPILVESVTWISGGIYVQYSFFFLLALYLYHKSQKDQRFYIPSILAYLASTFISEKAIVFPLILIAYHLSYEKKNIKAFMKKLIPFGTLGIIWGIWYFGRLGSRIQLQQEQYYQAKTFENPLTKIITAISSYLTLIFWPDKLSLYHSEIQFSQLDLVVRTVGVIIFFSLIFIAFKKNKTLFFWLSFFVISLIPTLIPVRISWAVAERYVYLGTAAIIAGVIYCLDNYLPLKQRGKLFGLFVIVLLLLMIRTGIRNTDWRDEDALWMATAQTAPSDYKTHNNVGVVYQKRKDYKKAIESFERSIKLNPRFKDGYYNLAVTYLQMGNEVRAFPYYMKTIELDPNYWQAYNGAGAILVDYGKSKEAIEVLTKGISKNKNYAPFYHNLGKAYELKGDSKNALLNYMKAVEHDPRLWQSYTNIAAIYYTQERYDLAEKYILKALEIKPGYKPLVESLNNLRSRR